MTHKQLTIDEQQEVFTHIDAIIKIATGESLLQMLPPSLDSNTYAELKQDIISSMTSSFTAASDLLVSQLQNNK